MATTKRNKRKSSSGIKSAPVATTAVVKKTATRTTKAKSGKARQSATDAAPVTLDQARRLAAAKRPLRATRQALAPPPTPADVGKAREDLEKERAAERARRMREYTDTMKIMKKRGAARPAAAAKGRRGAAKATVSSFKPLQVMAEGDSWFDYPFPMFHGGIIDRLQKLLGVPILNMAHAGDEARAMLGVDQRKRLVKTLKQGCPAGGPWEVLLFSGGGNDIVDNPMALWVRDWKAGASAKDLIHQPRFDAALALVHAAYEDLITLRDQLSVDTHLFFQCYDFAIPDGRPVCFSGPWLKPTFDLRGFPQDRIAAFAVVKEMLSQFAAMLNSLTTHAGVAVIPTQNTLPLNQIRAWHNELHPSKDGFDSFAALFKKHLKTQFPTRVV